MFGRMFYKFKYVFKKYLEVENNQLKCDDNFQFISDAGHFRRPFH